VERTRAKSSKSIFQVSDKNAFRLGFILFLLCAKVRLLNKSEKQRVKNLIRSVEKSRYPYGENSFLGLFAIGSEAKDLKTSDVGRCVKMPSFHSSDTDEADNADKLSPIE